MTQFSPPPVPPAFTPATLERSHRPQPWSAAAITAFVLSLLGCLLIPAPLALILGIVAIFATKSGRKRGLGLAIAALPISLVTGVIGVMVLGGVFMVGGIVTASTSVNKLLAADNPAAVADFLESSTESFRANVSAEQLQAWAAQVAQKHGRLTADMAMGQDGAPPKTVLDPGGKVRIVLEMKGQFVNGPAPVIIEFARPTSFRLAVDDIQVDGVSPKK